MAFENFNAYPQKKMPQFNGGNTTTNDDGNNSGQGTNTPVPDVVAKHFNWGAFLLSWIWGIGNKTYITLLSFVAGFIPFVGALVVLGMQIWFGIKGNTWAWQNKRFQSVEHFHENQKKWTIAGVIVSFIFVPLAIAGVVAALTLPTLMTNTEAIQNKTMMQKNLNTAQQVVLMNEAMEQKCDLTGEGLASCFEKRMSITDRNKNVLNASDMTVWTFNADGICKDKNACTVTVSNNGNDLFTISLYTNDEGYLKLDDNEVYGLIK